MAEHELRSEASFNARFLPTSDEQTERNLTMTTPILASAALKPMFEEHPNTLKKLGLDDAVLGPIMSHLTKTYTDAAEFALAVKAAKVLGNADDYRVVFNAMRSSKEAAHHFVHYNLHDDYVFLLMKVGTEAELRTHAEHDDGDIAVDILRQLKDVAGLAILGRKLEDKYYALRVKEKRKKMSSNDTDFVLGDAISAYKAAAELGNEQMPKEMMRFGDRLKKHDGVRASYSSRRRRRSMFDDSPRSHPLAEAYEANGTTEGFKKMAAVYLELFKSKDTYGNQKKNHCMVLAAEAFIKAQDFEEALSIAQQLAARKDIVSAIKVATKTDKKVGFALLEQYALGAIQEVTGPVKKAILDYLKDHSNDLPFHEDWTYWCDSMSNDTWEPSVSRVNYLAGRFDKSPIRIRHGRGGNGSIAKHLYASDKADTISKINDALTRHLFVGWMLSGITYELKYGSHNSLRKYEHPWYAAWRTFDKIGRNECKDTLELPSDIFVKELHQYLEDIYKEWYKLKADHKCTPKSEQFLTEKLTEMQTNAKQVYDAVGKEIEGLVAHL